MSNQKYYYINEPLFLIDEKLCYKMIPYLTIHLLRVATYKLNLISNLKHVSTDVPSPVLAHFLMHSYSHINLSHRLYTSKPFMDHLIHITHKNGKSFLKITSYNLVSHSFFFFTIHCFS